MMKSLLVLMLAAAVLLGGCATLTETPKESYQRIMAAQKLQMRMAAEDVQYVFLLEKPTFLTPWAVRGGLP
jgi:uncharacterized protein YceK